MNLHPYLKSCSHAVRQQIAKIDEIPCQGQLRPDEKRTILRVLFALYEGSRQRTPKISVNTQNHNAKLLGVGKNTVGRLELEWNKAQHNMNGDDTNLEMLSPTNHSLDATLPKKHEYLMMIEHCT